MLYTSVVLANSQLHLAEQTHFYPVIAVQFLYTLCQKSTVVQSLYTLVSKKYSSTLPLTLGSKCDGLCVQ